MPSLQTNMGDLMRSQGLKSYHNTTGLEGETLTTQDARSSKQEDIILDFFEAHPEGAFTPFEIGDILFDNTPITSVRRGMTNLAKRGLLEKTEIVREGPYGHRNHCWRLRGER